MTVVIPTDDAQAVARTSSVTKSSPANNAQVMDDRQSGKLPPLSLDTYIPDLFRLPINDVNSTDIIEVSVVYIESLYYSAGQYRFALPFTFAQDLAAGSSMEDCLSISCTINSVSPGTEFSCNSHFIKIDSNEFPQLKLHVSDFTNFPQSNHQINNIQTKQPDFQPASVDFIFGYSINSNDILPSILKELDPSCPAALSKYTGQPVENFMKDRKDNYTNNNLTKGGAPNDALVESGTFLMHITPPSDGGDGFFSRNMVFMLDRSGSMTGQPFSEATRALCIALGMLKPCDKFTIISFDHRQVIFNNSLVPATPENIYNAQVWIRTFIPERGGTDIMTPLKWALDLVEGTATLSQHHVGKDGATANGSNGDRIRNDGDAHVLPFVVLLTDGCVANEREICKMPAFSKGDLNTRILTFGIGSFCNWYFLKMLATMGRGFTDVVHYKEKIFCQIVQLISTATMPVLTNVALEIDGVHNVEIYPMPIPDLFMGNPLSISGYYQGNFPERVTVHGFLANGTKWSSSVKVDMSDVVPVSKVFIKQRMDMLTSQFWLLQEAEMQRQVTEISCKNQIASAYTTMISYETTHIDAQKDMKLEMTDVSENDPHSSLLADGGADSIMAQKHKTLKNLMIEKKWYQKSENIAALVAGNALVIGAAAFSFGNLGATLANASVITSFGDALSIGAMDIVDGGCCSELCSCGDCCQCVGDCLQC